LREGLGEEQIMDLADYAASAAYTPRERLALTYAERITLSDQDVDEALFAAVRAEFPDPAAVVELTALVAFENFRSKFNHALLVESNGICPVLLAGEPAR
jgi:alkylhydroperoxidase family enzyme